MSQPIGERGRGKHRFFVRKGTVVIAGLMLLVGAGIIYLAVDYERKKPTGSTKAECQMPDGTILVLEKVSFGTQHRLDLERPKRGILAAFGNARRNSSTQTTAQAAYMMWLSRHEAASGRSLDFDWWSRSVALDDDGCEIEDENPTREAYSSTGSSTGSGSRPFGPIASTISTTYDKILVRSSVRPFRHRGSSFKLRIYNTEGTVVAEFDAPDPSATAGKFPVWESESLPITKSVGDLDVTLTKVIGTRYETTSGNGQKRWAARFTPELRITRDGQPAKEWNRRNIQFYDAVGNAGYDWNCNLCPNESAWKLQVRMFRGEDAEFDSSEIWSVPGVPLPVHGSLERLSQSQSLQGVTMELLGVGGGGTISYSGLGSSTSAGTYSSTGAVFIGQKNWPYEIKHESGFGTATVQCELVHIGARFSGITPEHYFPDLLITDDQGRQVKCQHQGSWGDAYPTFWFMEIPPDAKSLDLKFIVQKGRTLEFLVKPPNVEPTELFQHADELARRGQWSEAAAEFARALDAYPDNHWHWYRSVCLQAQLEDLAGYRQQSRKMIELFGDTVDAYIAERTAKVCLLWPDSEPDLGRLADLAERAVKEQPNFPWFLLAKGIVEHRRGRFESAVEWLNKAQQAAGNSYYSSSLSQLFLAMSQHRLGQPDAARRSLDAAAQVIDQQFPKLEAGDLGASWNDWLMSQIVRREAEKLIGGGQ